MAIGRTAYTHQTNPLDETTSKSYLTALPELLKLPQIGKYPLWADVL